MTRPHHRSHVSVRRRRLWAAAGALLLLMAVAGIVYPMWWNHRSASTGHHLVAKATCQARLGKPVNAATVQNPGVLSIPAIDLVAPVLPGLTNSVLDVAVGHDPLTVWPGHQGESLLLAHDVSYFSALNRLRPGDLVIWTLGCEKSVFRVTGASVVRPGSGVETPASGSGLALITCWPTDALFWTPERYMVTTTLVSNQPLAQPATAKPPSLVVLGLSAPPELVAGGLSPASSGVRLGSLTVSGSPSPSFRQGPEPLVVANLALEEYAAAVKVARSGNRSWWDALALPGLPLPAPWSLADRTDVRVVARNNTVEDVVLSSSSVTLTLEVHDGILYVSGLTR